MKKSFFGFLFIVVLTIGTAAPVMAENLIHIGCVTPLTGAYANYGINTSRGLEMGLEEYNAKGGVKIKGELYKFKVEVCDDESKSDLSVTCGRKLASMYNVPIIYTPASWSGFPLSGFNERMNFLIICTSQSPTFTTRGNKLLIRWVSSAKASMPAWMDLLTKTFEKNNLHIKKYGVLEADSEVGKQWSEAFREEWKKRGGTITGREVVNMNSTDFYTNLTSLIAGKPDAIQLCSAPDEQTCIIAEQARSLGYKGIFTTTMTTDGVKLLELCKAETVEDSFLESTAWGVGGPLFDEFRKKYQEKYNETPIFIAGLSYEGGRAIAMAIEKAQSLEPAKIKAVFPSLLPLPDCMFCGRDMNPETGEVIFPVYLKHVKGGKIIPVKD